MEYNLTNKIIAEHGITLSRKIAIDILLSCQKIEEQNIIEKINIQEQELVNPYKIGMYVKYVRQNPTNQHLFTLGKNYEILFSIIQKNNDKENSYFSLYTILDDFGQQKQYHTKRQNCFELV